MHGPNLFLAFALKGAVVTIYASLLGSWRKRRLRSPEGGNVAESGLLGNDIDRRDREPIAYKIPKRIECLPPAARENGLNHFPCPW